MTLRLLDRLKILARLVAIATVTTVVIGGAYLAGFATQRLSAIEARTAQPAPQATVASEPENADNFDVFWEAWGILQQEFYGPLPSDEEMVYGAIRGALESLGDSHTAFYSPQQAHLFEESLNGSFEGIGATVDKRDGHIVIIAPLPDTPASRAGLRAGDVILAVDGEALLDAELWEAVAKIRGPRGTPVVLTIERAGRPEPFDVTIRRARVEIRAVESRAIRKNGTLLAYVKLHQFNNSTPRELRSRLSQLLDENPSGVILDLRGNPGGYLHVAIDIASEFIDEGLILTENGTRGWSAHEAESGGLLAGDNALPLAVLVDRGSASASEIVAGAIQDHGRGRLIGETTFGKGSVQVSHDLSDGSNLRVTIARWFTPDGRQIHGQGLQPDVVVPQSGEPTDEDADPQLDRAVQLLMAQIDSDPTTGSR